LSIAFPIFSNCARQETRNEDPQIDEETRKKFVLGPGVVEEDLNLAGLNAEIELNFGNIRKNFENNEFDEMVAKRASLSILPEKKKIHKREKRKEYWERKKIEEKYTSVEFVFKKAYIFREEKSDMDQYDAIAYVVYDFKLKKEKEGELVKNQDGEGEESYRHTLGCRWKRR
jgi:hypothetical protein